VKKPVAHVTDHAVLRYLERVKGIDIEAVRLEVGHVVDRAVEMGAGAAIVDGVRYVLNERTIVTVTPVKMVPLRDGRKRRVKARDDDQWGAE
jgi:hypothetical protein